jgi:shikimate kinase
MGAMDHHIVLIGQMGAGKTTIGRMLAERLGRPFSDSDGWLEAQRRTTATSLLDREGLDALHDAEAAHLAESLASTRPLVIAAAASTIEHPELVEALAGHRVVWLRATLDTLSGRIERGESRPALGEVRRYVTELDQRRREAYEAAADLIVDVDDRTAASVAGEIASLLETPAGDAG